MPAELDASDGSRVVFDIRVSAQIGNLNGLSRSGNACQRTVRAGTVDAPLRHCSRPHWRRGSVQRDRRETHSPRDSAQRADIWPRKARAAFASMVSNTGCRSPGELRDDLEHVGGRGLLLQRFAQLVEQPRVLDGDDGLSGEILDQFDLLVGEGTHLLTVDDDQPRSTRRPSARERIEWSECDRPQHR